MKIITTQLIPMIKPFETITQTIERRLTIGVVIIAFVILFIGACLLLWIEQHHEMERAILPNL